MKYYSTKSKNLVSFKETLFNGIAENGGLYIPETIPLFDFDILNKTSCFPYKKKNSSFHDITFNICRQFIDISEIPDKDLKKIIYKSYPKSFKIPLIQLKNDLYVLELFHGPTYAFKDIALQFLGNLLEYFLNKTKSKINVICATSGDTGSAAIYSVRNKKSIRCFVLHPKDSISSIQKAQMTTVLDSNIYNYEINGTFDDCQEIVKELNAKTDNLTTFNSINWTRIMIQISYYFYAYSLLKNKNITFSVPTGNFGNILAGFYAHKMGLPIEKLIIATNSNKTLFNFLETGILNPQKTIKTLSPAMDISIPSNLERLLYYYKDSNGHVNVNELKKIFVCKTISDYEVLNKIRETFVKFDYVIDPHTAIGLASIDTIFTPTICLATAHPGKFPETISQILNTKFIPYDLNKLLFKQQKYTSLNINNAYSKIKNDIDNLFDNYVV